MKGVLLFYAATNNSNVRFRSFFVLSPALPTDQLATMGVQGLWTLIEPTARPVQLETLRNRKMAVDASIWMHQFMRTMRDKEGNALRNGHLLGFFRRLCKLLFYNIKPVFVFDGGAPELKRTTIVSVYGSY